jgi:hypothetical protein
MKKAARPLLIFFFLVTIAIIAVLVYRPEFLFRPRETVIQRQTKIIVPRTVSPKENDEETVLRELMASEDSSNAKVVLNDGEIIVSVLTENLDEDLMEEQIIAYRNFTEASAPIWLTCIDFDNQSKTYQRLWNVPSAVTQPGTVSLYTKDLIGDRSVCVVLTGMTAANERTMTIFRRGREREAPKEGLAPLPFEKIAEIRIDGSITIQEDERSQAYQMGLTKGTSFTIAAYGRDAESGNILDQIEIIHTYNENSGVYRQSRITRIPGSQVEERRVRALLTGSARDFEAFIGGLWYYVGSQGTLDNRQYIYFDPQNRELIFYGDEIQQVFQWQSSSATRYGLYISSQNFSVTTLRRSIDIELESLNSIRIRVIEDVRLPIRVNDSWDGSYRKADSRWNPERTFASSEKNSQYAVPYLDAIYEGAIGKLTFYKDGTYELYTNGNTGKGIYTFFFLEGRELLELRPGSITGLSRETYLVQHQDGQEAPPEEPGETLTLVRVRLSTRGFQDVHEAAISLARVTSQ